MKRLIASSVVISTLAVSSAMAADIPVRAPAAAPPPPVFSWTGPYVGVTAGIAGDKFTYPLSVTGVPVSATANVTSSGFLFGGTIGYNYQFANRLVLGAEADWSWADVAGQINLSAALGPIGIAATAGSKLENLGTLRARVGYAWNRALLYATAGYAWGRVRSGLSASLGPLAIALSRSNNVSGWVVGAGIEYAITGNWSLKTEYLYVNFDRDTLFATALGPATLNLDVETDVHIVRAGLNYRFGGFLGSPQLPALAGPPVDWTGFYIGLSGGFAGDKFTYPLTVTGAPVSASADVTSGGLLVGGTIGYNYQFANNFVIGLEADWSWANVDGQVGLNATLGPIGIGITAGSELESLGTLRARVGYSWNRLLVYGTGGFAWGKVNSGLSAGLGPLALTLSRGHNLTGWTVGAGAEYALTNNLSVKTEYLYTDLGDATLLNVAVGGATVNLDIETKFHTVRAGLNYRFGSRAPAVVAKY